MPKNTIPKHVREFIDSIKDVEFFSCKGAIDPNWKFFSGSTWEAARSAAHNAAYSAARDVAWNTSRDAGLLAMCLLVGDKIDKKHLEYAKARWEVWERGYGVAYDVNGKLYVYGKLNGLQMAKNMVVGNGEN